MIGATRFSGAYGSFWRDVTPTMDLFVRKINLDLYNRVEPPADYQVEPKRSALVAEAAFALFDLQSRHEGDRALFFQRFTEQATDEARRRLALLSAENIGDDLNPDELNATQELFRRLSSFFIDIQGRELVLKPYFPGCGFVDQSEGDIIYGDTLFEIKSVDRNFRSVDIKQLITYAALNHKSRSYHFREIGIFNPRMGTEFRMGLDDVCMEVAGISSIELLEIIAYSIASGEVSR